MHYRCLINVSPRFVVFHTPPSKSICQKRLQKRKFPPFQTFSSFISLVLHEPFFKSKNQEDTADIGNIHKNSRFSNYRLKQHKYDNLINFEFYFISYWPHLIYIPHLIRLFTSFLLALNFVFSKIKMFKLLFILFVIKQLLGNLTSDINIYSAKLSIIPLGKGKWP